jgi:hypothetical protein
VFRFADPTNTEELHRVESEARVYRKLVQQTWADPNIAMIAAMISGWVAQLNDLALQRANLVRECVRIDGSVNAPNAEIVCGVRLHSDLTSRFQTLRMRISHPGLVRVRYERGSDVAQGPDSAADDGSPHVTRLTLIQPDGAADWAPGDREIARLVLQVDPAAPAPPAGAGCALVEVRPEIIGNTRGNDEVLCHTVPGWVCLI